MPDHVHLTNLFVFVSVFVLVCVLQPAMEYALVVLVVLFGIVFKSRYLVSGDMSSFLHQMLTNLSYT